MINSPLKPPATPAGRHLLVDYYYCDVEILKNQQIIEKLMIAAALEAAVSVIHSVFRRFEPQGITGVVVIAESHLSIHTWPEHAYAAVDFFTCGEGLPERAELVLRRGLRANKVERLLVERGTALNFQKHHSRHRFAV